MGLEPTSDLEIRHKKGVENLVADHLSRIQKDEEESKYMPIDDAFSDEYLMVINTNTTPWYANFINFLACGVFPTNLSFQGKKKFLTDVKFYQSEDPILYKHCMDQIMRKCVLEEEMESILTISIEERWEIILVLPKQRPGYFILDFIVLHYSKMLIIMSMPVMLVKEVVIFLEETRCLSTTSLR